MRRWQHRGIKAVNNWKRNDDIVNSYAPLNESKQSVGWCGKHCGYVNIYLFKKKHCRECKHFIKIGGKTND